MTNTNYFSTDFFNPAVWIFDGLGLWNMSQSSSVSIESEYGAGDRVPSPAGENVRPLTFASRPVLGPTQPQEPSVPSPGVKRGRGVMLTPHPDLVPRSRMSSSYTSCPAKRLHGVSGQFYFLE
jgi:hypothetical protein